MFVIIQQTKIKSKCFFQFFKYFLRRHYFGAEKLFFSAPLSLYFVPVYAAGKEVIFLTENCSTSSASTAVILPLLRKRAASVAVWCVFICVASEYVFRMVELFLNN